MMKVLSKKDWFYEGFSLLEEGGSAKITIDTLCQRLNVTKGSFYHHFKHIRGYTEELMEFWLEENTLAVMRQADQVQTEEDRLKTGLQLIASLRHKAELHIRAWSFFHTTVKEYVHKADQIRLNYLAGLFIQLGYDQKTAHDRALLDYAILIGIQHLAPDTDASELSRLQRVYYDW
jgi:AcrR family transcriptional regulator